MRPSMGTLAPRIWSFPSARRFAAFDLIARQPVRIRADPLHHEGTERLGLGDTAGHLVPRDHAAHIVGIAKVVRKDRRFEAIGEFQPYLSPAFRTTDVEEQGAAG